MVKTKILFCVNSQSCIDICHAAGTSAAGIFLLLRYLCGCGYTVGRHTRSLDTSRKVCGHCRGNFELVPKSKQMGAGVKGVGAVNSPTSKQPKYMWVYEYND